MQPHGTSALLQVSELKFLVNKYANMLPICKELLANNGYFDFVLRCWRRLVRVPWTARRSNQSILKEINPEYTLEGQMLKLQCSGHLTWRVDWLEKTLMLGKIKGRRKAGDRGWSGWMALLTQWTWDWANSGRQWRTRKPGRLQSMRLQRVRHDWATEQHLDKNRKCWKDVNSPQLQL